MTAPLEPIEKAIRQVERENRYRKRLRQRDERDPRTCQYAHWFDGQFCASGECPDCDGLPCVQVGGQPSDCYHVVARVGRNENNAGPGRYDTFQCLCDCACKHRPTMARKKAFEKWRAKRQQYADVWRERDRPIKLRRYSQEKSEGKTRQNEVARAGARELTEAEQEDARWLRYQYIDLRRAMRDIGAEIGLSCGGVSKRLKKYGIPARPRARRKKLSRLEATT